MALAAGGALPRAAEGAGGAGGPLLRRHPSGTILLCSVEMLERFSFYAMSGLLVLFLAGAPASGGFGWPGLRAIQLNGIYVGILWFTPLLGGWLGDRRLGPRRAVIAGGFAIAFGQALMASPMLVPALFARATGLPIEAALKAAHVPLGFVLPGAELRAALTASLSARLGTAASAAQAQALVAAYLAQGWAFFAGLGFLALGNGLLKPNITVMLGELYGPADPRRDEAFTLFYIGINIGAVLSALVAGTVAERFGWSLGFAVSSLVVLIGIAMLLRLQRLFPAGVGARRRPAGAGGRGHRAPIPRGPLVYVIVMMLFASLFWGAFMQTFGLLSLFAFHDVDRMILGFEVPAPWFSSLTPFFLTAAGPLFQAGMNALARRGVVPGTIARFTGGFVISAAAFAMLALAVALGGAVGGAKMPMIWLVLFYLVLAIGELSLSPAGNAMAARHVEPAAAGRLMSIWFLCYGIGSFLSSAFGSLAARFSIPSVLAILAAMLLAAAIGIRSIGPRLAPLVAPNR